jgi:hypothetical protein
MTYEPHPIDTHGSDVRDTAEELDALGVPALREALEVLGAEVTESFEKADALASQYQRSHGRTTWWATRFGTLAVLLAVVELVGERFGANPAAAALLVLLESGSVLVAAVAVMNGLFAFRRESWLLERFRAERLRALKFVYLIDPALWCGDAREREDWRARLHDDVERALALERDAMDAFAGESNVPSMLTPEQCGRLEPAPLEALIAYYQRKRLGPRREYFLGASKRAGESGERLLAAFFFTSVGLVLVHAVVTAVWLQGHVSEGTLAVLLAAASVAVPVLWAGIRTGQSAEEITRNTPRSHARHSALAQLSDRLQATRDDPRQALWTMRLSEFILDMDQREWLRLLRAAEWYG